MIKYKIPHAITYVDDPEGIILLDFSDGEFYLLEGLVAEILRQIALSSYILHESLLEMGYSQAEIDHDIQLLINKEFIVGNDTNNR